MNIKNNNLNSDILKLKMALLVDFEDDGFDDEVHLLNHAKKVLKSNDIILPYLIKFLKEYKQEIKKDDFGFVEKYKENFYSDLNINSIINVCFFNCIIYALCHKAIDIKEFNKNHFLINIRFLQKWLNDKDPDNSIFNQLK